MKIVLVLLLLSTTFLFHPGKTRAFLRTNGNNNSTENFVDSANFADGSFVVIGNFNGYAQIGNIDLLGNETKHFVAKFDRYGNVLWAKNYGGESSSPIIGNSITTLEDGSIIFTGTSNNTAQFDSYTLTVNSESSSFGFVVMLDPDGTVLWAKKLGGDSAFAEGRKIKSYQDGNIVVSGSFSGTSQTFGTFNLNSTGEFNTFVTKMDRSGNFIWAKAFTGEENFPSDITTFTDGSSILIRTKREIVFGSTIDTSKVSKLDSTGVTLWEKSIPITDVGDIVTMTTIDGFNDGSAAIAGFFNIDSLVLGETTLSPLEKNEIFITKIDTNGNFVWATQTYTDFHPETTGFSVPLDIEADDNFGIILVGNFHETMTLGNTTLISKEIYATDGHFASKGIDGLVSRLDKEGNFLWAQQIAKPFSFNSARTVSLISNEGYLITTGQFASGSTFFGDPTIIYGSRSYSSFMASLSLDTGLLYNVQIPNQPPIASAGLDQTVTEGSEVYFSGSSSSDPDGITDIVSYIWDFGDGSTATGITPVYTYYDNGTYNATLTVTDTYGETSTDSLTVTVNNVVPIATFTVNPDTILVGETTTLTMDNPYDPSLVDTQAGFTYSFDCTSNGVFELLNSTQSSFICTYQNAGNYTSLARITDKDEGYTDYTNTVTVQTPLQATNTLVDLVETFNLQQGINNSLDAKLDSAINALEDVNQNNDQAAVNSLQAFINAVEAQRGNQITNEQADSLVAQAQKIIDSLLL